MCVSIIYNDTLLCYEINKRSQNTRLLEYQNIQIVRRCSKFE